MEKSVKVQFLDQKRNVIKIEVKLIERVDTFNRMVVRPYVNKESVDIDELSKLVVPDNVHQDDLIDLCLKFRSDGFCYKSYSEYLFNQIEQLCCLVSYQRQADLADHPDLWDAEKEYISNNRTSGYALSLVRKHLCRSEEDVSKIWAVGRYLDLQFEEMLDCVKPKSTTTFQVGEATYIAGTIKELQDILHKKLISNPVEWSEAVSNGKTQDSLTDWAWFESYLSPDWHLYFGENYRAFNIGVETIYVFKINK